MARENRGWGYDRIVGALANLGHAISDRTVGNILRRHNIAPTPERSRRAADVLHTVFGSGANWA
jgi:hypothetical protein